MKIRFVIAMASVAALCACGSGGNKSSETRNTTTAGKGTQSEAPAPQQGGGDPTLAREIEEQVAAVQSQLPINQGSMSITAMEAKGTELITHMQLPVEVTDAVLAQIQQQLPVQACANPQAREMFRRGGTYTYKIKDSSGEEFSTSVSSC